MTKQLIGPLKFNVVCDDILALTGRGSCRGLVCVAKLQMWLEFPVRSNYTYWLEVSDKPSRNALRCSARLSDWCEDGYNVVLHIEGHRLNSSLFTALQELIYERHLANRRVHYVRLLYEEIES